MSAYVAALAGICAYLMTAAGIAKTRLVVRGRVLPHLPQPAQPLYGSTEERLCQ